MSANGNQAGTATSANAARTIVVKIGTSSLTGDDATSLDKGAIARLCADIAAVRAQGHHVVLVSSAAIAAGMAKLGIATRPRTFEALQALSAVGQIELMVAYDRACEELGFTCGQVLLAPPDFFDRSRYLRARSCIEQQLAMGVLPVVNENDAVADDAIRFGDNDRIAALVAHLVKADLLVLLTDTAGLLTADPRVDDTASLIEEVRHIDSELEERARGAATTMSQGGMSSKLSAAKIASWSGVDAIIAGAARPSVLVDAIATTSGDVAETGVGTLVRARSERLGARKLWIAFALATAGRVTVDAGARTALIERGVSLLAVGVTEVDGEFDAGAAVEVVGPDGSAFAKGLVSADAATLRAAVGEKAVEVIHRDAFVLLPDS